MSKDLLMKDERYVGVVFDAWLDGSFNDNLNIYTYISSFDVEVGDIVIVETANGLKVGTIAKTKATPHENYTGITKEVVTVVDFEEFLTRKKLKTQFRELEGLLAERAREVQKEIALHKLAEFDEELKEQLEELKSLKKTFKKGVLSNTSWVIL